MNNIINRVLENETETIMQAMDCSRERAEYLKSHRDDLIPANFHKHRNYGGIAYEDLDSLITADIITTGADNYRKMQMNCIL